MRVWRFLLVHLHDPRLGRPTSARAVLISPASLRSDHEAGKRDFVEVGDLLVEPTRAKPDEGKKNPIGFPNRLLQDRAARSTASAPAASAERGGRIQTTFGAVAGSIWSSRYDGGPLRNVGSEVEGGGRVHS
jgi:hypothetical protein